MAGGVRPTRSDLLRAIERLLTDHSRILPLDTVLDSVRRRHPLWLWHAQDYSRYRQRLTRERHDTLIYDEDLDALALARWFATSLWNLSPGLLLSADCRVAIAAAVETALRMPHMINKRNDGAYNHALRIAKGQTIEQVVSRWAQQHWPDAFAPPDNYRSWQTMCRHDFKLRLFGRWLEVDVAGPSGDDQYGAVPNKPMAHLHIAAELSGDCVVVRGYCGGERFKQGVLGDQLSPIDHLAVMLNWQQDGRSREDWDALQHRIGRLGRVA